MYNLDEIKNRLSNILDKNRLIHSNGVADESVKLAHIYGEDENNAYLAGILHDCAKNFTKEEKINLCKKYDIDLSDIFLKQIDLTHGFIGSKIAKYEYNIDNEDILNAIKYHTTGRANMSTLEKIVYLADYIEPNRKPFDGIEKARELCYKDLDKAMIFVLNKTIEYTKTNNRLVHNYSIEALNFLENAKE